MEIEKVKVLRIIGLDNKRKYLLIKNCLFKKS